ncbi:MAG TPA: fructose-6-phosphate aldolase [Candidatus Hydrothermia bacterium]|nr:fructose-6-phosphate aldolase [Candidatus Hydrothermae bacterium]MDD3649804.1 fructose-6-phosphate aldolase [Candidatus Hydrothermia bacterium]MDD5572973.1 fructose-6-phosphate aldolase [Candidatus Hydrothermia bacterium]HOK22935.1 fructose-6-phosphate aldolase [Candidatus Hydrothermia bacterium]HOL23644.1 fructose-6-phosphate aldolase [Candidatus Hydrothermia bacterium]
MKIFVDTASIKEIEDLAQWGIIEGATTNPTLLSEEGGDPVKVIKRICEILKGPVSAEVVSQDCDGMVREARELARIDEHVVVKIPMTVEGLKAVKILSRDGIKTNVTLIFQPVQALLAAKAGATYVSPFVGRLDDIGHTGLEVVGQILQIYENYGFGTQVIVASVRHPLHVLDAALMGAHIATIPPKVIRQIVNHPLTDIGIDKFLKDWEKLKGK